MAKIWAIKNTIKPVLDILSPLPKIDLITIILYNQQKYLEFLL